MTTKLCGRLDKLAVAGFVSLLSAWMLQAASISLVAPDDGATYDTHSSRSAASSLPVRS